MNETLHEEKHGTSDMTTADHVSLTVAVLAMVGSWIGFATQNMKILWLALAVALPATVVKVRLTRARSQAAEREEQITGRDRRAPNTVRSGTRAAVTP